MDEGQFAADFLAKNLEKILSMGQQALGQSARSLRVKLKLAYTDYLELTNEKYSKSKSFFIRNQAVNLYSYYVPTSIESNNTVLESPSFSQCINVSKKIIITGLGGSGKSVLTRHLFLDCIRDKNYAPILIELRDLNNEEKNLDEFISYTLDLFKFSIEGDYIKRAKTAGHFCFFFDGYDEVNPNQRKKILNQIQNISNKFPLCPIFISSRPDDTFNGLDDFCIFKMLPLSLDSAQSLVRKLPFDEDIKSKFIFDLANELFKKHESFLSNPLLLSIMLLTYGEHAQIPSKLSIFYNQAYEALFQRHDANKGAYSRKRLTSLDIQDFSKVFSLFALQTYDKRLFRMPRTTCLEFIIKSRDSLKFTFEAEDYLNDLLSAACLLVEDGLEIAFSHRSFQEYFVALQISLCPPEIQEKLVTRYANNIRTDNVLNLLLEINPELVERFLFIPQLEKLFKSINVKREVGVTHTAAYLKSHYDAFHLERNEGLLFASRKKDFSVMPYILSMAIRHAGQFKFQQSPEIYTLQKEILSKFHVEGETSCQYQLESLTYKSPFLVDIMNGPFNVFSVNFLSAGFKTFKLLQKKHTSTIQNLDVLLGIR